MCKLDEKGRVQICSGTISTNCTRVERRELRVPSPGIVTRVTTAQKLQGIGARFLVEGGGKQRHGLLDIVPHDFKHVCTARVVSITV